MTQCIANIICTGSITNLVLGSMKKNENIIKFDNKYKTKYFFSKTFLFLRKKTRPGKERRETIKIGIM